ncbi:STAS domain-containing protein [Ferruginibacter sp.]|nr:STAS domain-containing protein [Ferruginibacter sp.]
MNVKIDTKEKFTVITPQETVLAANMTAELSNLLLENIQKDIRNVILNMTNVEFIADNIGVLLAFVQQQFYERNCSFVICNLHEVVEKNLADIELLELMNVTPTESEAWDIVQMEEIERELLSDD